VALVGVYKYGLVSLWPALMAPQHVEHPFEHNQAPPTHLLQDLIIQSESSHLVALVIVLPAEFLLLLVVATT